MGIKTENIIDNIKESIREYEAFKASRDELVVKQTEVIKGLIEKNNPIYEWIRNKTTYYFSHPTLNYKSRKGPVLAYQEDDGRLVVYDTDAKSIKVVDIGEKYNNDTFVSATYLVEKGYFVSAVEGLTYLEEMFDRYVGNMADHVIKLDKELNEIKAIF